MRICLAIVLSFVAVSIAAATAPGIESVEFIYESAPFPACHASTIVETKEGLVATPVEVANGSRAGAHFERTQDNGLTWSRTAPINDGKKTNIIQPSILIHGDGKLQTTEIASIFCPTIDRSTGSRRVSHPKRSLPAHGTETCGLYPESQLHHWKPLGSLRFSLHFEARCSA